MKKDKTIKGNPVQKVAVLIDGDNALSAKLGHIAGLAFHYGSVTVKRNIK